MICCPACGTRNREGSFFCSQCGKALSEQAPSACPRCGAPNAPGTVHCQACGLDLMGTQQPPTKEGSVPVAPGEAVAQADRRGGLPPWLDAIEEEETTGAESASDKAGKATFESRSPASDWSAEAIPIEPIVGVPYRARPWTPLPPTSEQQRAAELFGLAATEEVHASPTELPVPGGPRGLSAGVRWFIAFALLFALVLPRFWPLGPLTSMGAVAPAVSAAALAIDALPPDSVVLVACDYDASLAGEVQPIAEAYLRALLSRRAGILLVSTLPEGAALAEMALDRVLPAYPQSGYGERILNLGYVPGGEAAVRALATNLHGAVPVDYRRGLPLESFAITARPYGARNLPLIIVLGRDLAAVQRWIEQVGMPFGTPIVAGVPALAEPTISAYQSAGQLRGVVAGVQAAASLESLGAGQGSATRMLPQLRIGVWTVTGVLILVNLASLISLLRRPSGA